VLAALIESARFITVVADDGQMMTEMSLTVRNNGRLNSAASRAICGAGTSRRRSTPTTAQRTDRQAARSSRRSSSWTNKFAACRAGICSRPSATISTTTTRDSTVRCPGREQQGSELAEDGALERPGLCRIGAGYRRNQPETGSRSVPAASSISSELLGHGNRVNRGMAPMDADKAQLIRVHSRFLHSDGLEVGRSD